MTRTERYMRRVRQHLPRLDDDAGRAFLKAELEKWETRYARFIETSGESERRGDGAEQPTAFDFTETIAALQIAMAPFERELA